jgi:hypothetical protein
MGTMGTDYFGSRFTRYRETIGKSRLKMPHGGPKGKLDCISFCNLAARLHLYSSERQGAEFIQAHNKRSVHFFFRRASLQGRLTLNNNNQNLTTVPGSKER